MATHSDNPFASPAADVAIAKFATDPPVHDNNIEFSGRLQEEDLGFAGLRGTGVATKLFLMALTCLAVVILMGFVSSSLRETLGHETLGILFGVVVAAGYVSFLAACFMVPPPNFRWWKFPVSGTISKDRARLQFKHFSVDAPLTWFKTESVGGVILLKTRKEKISALMPLPGRWFSPEDFRAIESRLQLAAASGSKTKINPLDELVLDDGICVRKPARSGSLIRGAAVMFSHTAAISAFAALLIVNAINDTAVWLMATAAFFVLVGILTRIYYWRRRPEPPANLEQLGVAAWVTPKKLHTRVRDAIIEIDLDALRFEATCNGLSVTKIPIQFGMALHRDMCHRQQWEVLRQRLQPNSIWRTCLQKIFGT